MAEVDPAPPGTKHHPQPKAAPPMTDPTTQRKNKINFTPKACATKVVATVGPATDGQESALVAAGVSVFRVNFSHGEAAEHERRVLALRQAARDAGRHVAILGDLQGPKIRIGKFSSGTVELTAGDSFVVDADHPGDEGTGERVGTSYQSLAADCSVGDQLVLGDGSIELEVMGCANRAVTCRVITGGPLADHKGINKRGGGLSASALTPKDEQDILLAAKLDVDYLAVSFPRSAQDLIDARRLASNAKLNCQIVAKIERAETVVDDVVLDALISAADAVMIARGDLGIEIGYPALMGVQKRIARRARALNRPVITATQMMESMISQTSPTRAEVLDVANAVLDGTDAVMLSGETAIGDHPVKVVEAVVQVLRGAERSTEAKRINRRVQPIAQVDHSIALAAITIARNLSGVRAIACFTTSGQTPRLLSRFLGQIPIYAMVEEPKTLALVALYRSVQPVLLEQEGRDYDQMNGDAVRWLTDAGVVTAGDRVIVCKGDLQQVRTSGGTNTLKVIEI